MNSLSNHLNGKIKSRKMGPKGVLIKKEDARMWIVHEPTTSEDESCRTNIDKGYTIMRWSIRQ
jgi:hypothetical protein